MVRLSPPARFSRWVAVSQLPELARELHRRILLADHGGPRARPHGVFHLEPVRPVLSTPFGHCRAARAREGVLERRAFFQLITKVADDAPQVRGIAQGDVSKSRPACAHTGRGLG